MARLAVGVGLLGLAAWALTPLIFELHSTHAPRERADLHSSLADRRHGEIPLPGDERGNGGEDGPLFEVKNSLADEDRVDSLKDEEAYLAVADCRRASAT